jgi:uncharacterized protein YjiS (DUF1127 family)
MSALLDQSSAARRPRRTFGDVGAQVYRGLTGSWSQAGDALLRMYARSLQRMGLEDLDAHMLKDIGLTREAAKQEASRPFWQ